MTAIFGISLVAAAVIGLFAVMPRKGAVVMPPYLQPFIAMAITGAGVIGLVLAVIGLRDA